MKPSRFLGAVTTLFALATATPLAAQGMEGKGHEISVQTDVVYGQGLVGVSDGSGRLRDLHMDVYRPVQGGKPMAGRPAIVMVFGGAFHRGSKGIEHFEEDGASDSSMADYCNTFARAGYVCMAIEYRLVPEDPGLPASARQDILFPKAAITDPAATARIEVVRARMGLPPLDDRSREQLWNGILAAADDANGAVAYARDHSASLGIDPERIAIGGFSSGAITAINAAYALGAPVKAVVSISGGVSGYDLRKTLRSDMPPALFFLGQNDLAGIQAGTRYALAFLGNAGVETHSAWVPGFGHFYPMGAVSLGDDMSRTTVEKRLLNFLEQELGQGLEAD